MSFSLFRFQILCFLAVTVLSYGTCRAGDAEPAPNAELPKIADEPKLIDPASVMPATLAESVTVDLSDSSLGEVVEWLRSQQKLAVLVEQSALSDAGVLLGDPVSDRLDDDPLYLLLNRLRSLKLGWYFEDDVLHITSAAVAEDRMTTVPYNVGDLLDAGYDADTLLEVIENAIVPTMWDPVGGPGGLNVLCDVIFVRQNDEVHRKVQGLFAALGKHGRQTFALDPPQHLKLRQSLIESVSVNFEDTPLDAAVKELATKAKIDIRLDVPALRATGIRARQPFALKLSERKLETVLQAMIIDFELTWILRDGVLWITSMERAEMSPKTAVYDVRDLCRDDSEADALREAIMSQATPTAWDEVGGPATIQFAKAGVMVIRGEENLLMEVLSLLETYRTALRASKPRDRDAVDPDEVVTVYYRLHANVAEDLSAVLPKLVQPDSWKNAANPDAEGDITQVASPPDFSTPDAQLMAEANKAGAISMELFVARSVLIIRQTRAAHEEIENVIQRVQSGDPWGPMKFGDGLEGGGGFGGGFLSVAPRSATSNP